LGFDYYYSYLYFYISDYQVFCDFTSKILTSFRSKKHKLSKRFSAFFIILGLLLAVILCIKIFDPHDELLTLENPKKRNDRWLETESRFRPFCVLFADMMPILLSWMKNIYRNAVYQWLKCDKAFFNGCLWSGIVLCRYLGSFYVKKC
jgi:hypothetical protein